MAAMDALATTAGALLALAMALCLHLQVAHGHMCLMSPHQRGTMDLSQAGSNDCFLLSGPCGGRNYTTGSSIYNMKSGSSVLIRWQQNFNHYQNGNVGYFDISYAEGPSPSSERDFHLLGFASDYNAHSEAAVTNMSLAITVPAELCKHCILRMRYVSNKPGEVPFYQCSDVSFTDEETDPSFLRSQVESAGHDQRHALQIERTAHFLRTQSRLQDSRSPLGSMLALRGDSTSTDVVLVSVAVGTSKVSEIMVVDSSAVRSVGPRPASSHACHGSESHMEQTALFSFLDSIAAVDHVSGRAFFLLASGPVIQASQDLFATFSRSTGLLAVNGMPMGEGMVPRSSVDFHPSTGHLLLFSMVPEAQPGIYHMLLEAFSPESGMMKTVATFGRNDTYLNFQNSFVVGDTYYALLLNENDPFGLDAVFYTVDLHSGNLQVVHLNTKTWTFMSMFVYNGGLYAVSPGRLGETKWSVVQIDPRDGSVTLVFAIAPEGLFESYYGGYIFGHPYNGGAQEAPYFYYELRIPGLDCVTVQIDMTAQKAAFSPRWECRSMHNLALL